MRYAHAHALVYGKVWSVVSPLARDLPQQGNEPPEDAIVRAEERIAAWNARLDPDQRQAVANLAVFGMVPPWFYSARGIGRMLATDEADRRALLTGLDRLAAT